MTAGTPLELRTCHGHSHATVIIARGEIDLSSCGRLRTQLLASVEQGTTVLDLADVEFCDSSGLRVLVEAHHTSRARGSTFRLAAVSPAVAHVLELAGAADVFEMFPDVEAALKD
jgi:anti-sigma B factor antagonist